MFKKRFLTVILLAAIAFNAVLATPAWSQLPFLPQISWETLKLNQNPNDVVVSACVRLYGNCIFEILDTRANISQRIRFTEERLKDISKTYFQSSDAALKIYHRANLGQENVYIAVGEREVPIITLYNRDAATRGVNLEHQAQQIVSKLETGLKNAKQERQSDFLAKQGKLVAAILAISVLASYVVFNAQQRSLKAKSRITSASHEGSFFQPVSEYLKEKQKLNLREVQHRLLQFLQVGIWLGGSLLILGLFPQTRSTQLWIITILRIPLRIGAVSLVTYVLIRLSYVAIAKFNHTFSENYVLNRDTKQRMQLRVTTIARILGGIITLFWVVLGIIVGLTIIGINVTPLLAGAGILGLAFSFASQNLIKDTLNGFFIILEDQYAVGDVIKLNDVSGLVENLNLRITQLRDGQGRLITIPNSEIKVVANLSSQWSRAEIDIPVTYDTDINHALQIIEEVAQEMSQEAAWQEKILEPPVVLGVDNFSDRGSVVRVWIKTEPLKQWEVGREFRRRIQNAFDRAHISLPFPQQQIWLQQPHSESK